MRKYLLNTGLKLLVAEIILVALAGLLHWRVHWMEGKPFSDVLTVIGFILLLAASVGMMGRPYEVMNSPWGVPASPVHDTEQERHYNLIETFMKQRSFAFRLIVLGLATLLVSLVTAIYNI